MSQLADFHFLRPWLLVLIVPMVWLVYLWWQHTNLTNAWRKIVDHHLIDLLLNQKGLQKKIPIKTTVLATILFVLAISGPTWQQQQQPPLEKREARVILLDLSLSMYAEDVKPSRIDVALRKIQDILDRNEEGSIGLVVYAGDAFTISPLTTDANTVRSLVPSLTPGIMPVLGSNSIAAINQAVELFDNSDVYNGRILWITDGIESEYMEQVETRLSLTSHQLSILAVGTSEGSPIPLPNESGYLKDEYGAIIIPKLNLSKIKDFADRVNAKATTISVDDSDIEFLMQKDFFSESEFKESELKQQGFDDWKDYGPYFSLILLPIIAYAFRKGLVFIFAVVLFIPSKQSYAFDWQDLWQTKDQQAIEKFKADKPEEAGALFQDPLWKGASHYKAGNYQAALDAFSKVDSASGHYNRGNTLTQLGELEDAAKAYEKALSIQPNLKEAQKNKSIVESIVEQQKENEQKGDSSSNPTDEQNGQKQEQESNQNSQAGDNGNEQQQSTNSDQSSNDKGQQQSNANQQEQQHDQQTESKSGQGSEQETKNQDSEDGKGQEQNKEKPEDKKNANGQLEESTGEDSDQTIAQQNPNEMTEEQKKAFEQTLTQWLRKVPDEPARLLREKMRYEYQLRQQQNKRNTNKKKIW
jgi:Ca-activated chloride channel homolog